MLTRRSALAATVAATATTALALPAIAQSRTKVRFAGGGIALYGYMPFFVALGQDLFAKHGIEAEVAQFPGGARAMQALLGGSSDMVCGYYEHTIQMAAKGAHLQAFVLQARNSGLALGVRKELAGQIKTAADLKGRKIGVSAPGSATHLFAMQLLVKAGLKPTDASAIGVGTTATALSAFERGDIDALSLFDPIINDLENKGSIVLLADARDSAGTQAVFGGPYASGCLYADAGWIPKNEAAVRNAAAAIREATAFLQGATPDQAIGALQAGMCSVGRDVCDSAFTRNRDAFQHNGMVTPEMAQTVHRMLAGFDPAIAAAKVDLPATYTDRFVAA
ncbi:MAG TPA: ABC transporter substrate-binding protein [Acetobacteraceae bacterium]